MNISITSCDAGTANIVYGAPAKNAVGVIECNVATVISTGVGTASNFRVFANTLNRLSLRQERKPALFIRKLNYNYAIF